MICCVKFRNTIANFQERFATIPSSESVSSFDNLTREDYNAWTLTPEELLAKLDTSPHPEIYNAINYSMYDRATINNYNYAVTVHNATKIWSLADDWEELVSDN